MKLEGGRRNAEVDGAPGDLKSRTFPFGVRCVKLAEALPRTRAGHAIASQLVRCGTSVGANYRSARRARSRSEFVARLGVVEEECDEALYWLEMTAALDLIRPAALRLLSQEANELLAIVITAIKTARRPQTPN